jgi:holin-like protein
MIVEISRVLCCLALGEIVSRFSPIPLPGSVLGLLLLFGWLWHLGRVPPNLGSLADRMLELFGLFFVPAGVGVMIYKTLIARDFMPILLAVSVGTLVTICVTGLAASVLVGGETREGPK